MDLQKKSIITFCYATVLLSVACSPKFTEEDKGDFTLVKNEGGKTLGYNANSGVKLLNVDRYAFKDLSKDGKLDAYEDWRLPAEKRAQDLAGKMSLEQIAGLMLYSGHQSIPAGGNRFFGPATYGGKPFAESGAKASDLSDAQLKLGRVPRYCCQMEQQCTGIGRKNRLRNPHKFKFRPPAWK